MKLNYESTGSYVSAHAEGTAEEIAALVVALQERQGKSFPFSIEDFSKKLLAGIRQSVAEKGIAILDEERSHGSA